MFDIVHIGRTRKTHGVKGELKVEIKDAFFDDFLLVKVVFLEIDGKKIPYFVDNIRSTNQVFIKFQDITNPESAKPLTSKDLFIQRKDLSESSTDPTLDEFTTKELIGFLIFDSQLGRIGKIEEIETYPHQLMAFVTYNDKNCMIPLSDGLITGIDPEEKVIEMNLPEGLLELD